MGKTKPYMKLDHDWYLDSKVDLFISRNGKASGVDLIKLFCVLSEFYGSVDLEDDEQKLRLQKVLGKKGKSLATFLDKIADCNIINAEVYRGLKHVESERSIKDGQARKNRREYALAASEAAAEKRNEGKGAP